MSNNATSFELLPAAEVERLLPAYSEISFLAQGGMAAVYRGVQTSLERPVAIKILPSEFGADEAFRLRFTAEAKAMAKLNHPNLVGIFDFGQADDLLYLVMEFVEGQTLYEHAYGEKMEEVKALDLCYQVADGLAHAHEHGILHRDIKPANVLLDEHLHPKLGDFGLAEGEERAEGDELVFGTPGYTSPEVMADPTAADEKSDSYAVGVMLYELLTTTIPSDPYQAPSQLAQSDPRIDSLIAKALQYDPAERHQSARELADDLQALSKKIKASPRRKLIPADSSASVKHSLKVEKAAPRKSAKRTPVLATDNEKSAPPRPSPTPAPTSQTSSNLPFIRNLIIIAFLCFAIFAVWKATKQKEGRLAAQEAKLQEKREREERRKKAEAQRARNEREAQLANKEQANPSPTENQMGSSLPVPEEAPPLTLSPREQLEKLRISLVEGRRDKFPEGTLQRGTSHFFFIDQKITWYEAIEFAEQYGAHLAIAPSKSDLSWLANEIPTDDDIWMGAGAVSRSEWIWFDESISFEHTRPRTSTKVAGALSNIGLFKARHPSERHPFFIQWDSDGKQLVSREKDLATLTETLTSSDPVWPAGIRSYEDRRYLTLAREVSQAEAAAIASEAGGTLAIPSNELEASFLRDYAAESGLARLWMGGEKRSQKWTWSTNESWDFARWSDGFPSEDIDASGVLLASDGWQNENPLANASGFIIEWSDDAKDAPEGDEQNNNDLGDISELRAKAKRFLAKALAQTNKRAKDNHAAQGMAIRQWLRNIPKEEARRYEEHWLEYSAKSENDSSYFPEPATTPLASASAEAAKIMNRYYRQQQADEAKLISSAESLRVSYLRKLVRMLEESRARGLTSQLGPLQEEIDGIGTNGASFLEYLGLR